MAKPKADKPLTPQQRWDAATDEQRKEWTRQLAQAPLAVTAGINLPLGKRPAPRGPKVEKQMMPGDLTPTEVRMRKEKLAQQKVEQLLDYFATTGRTAQEVAAHLYREPTLEQTNAVADGLARRRKAGPRRG